MGTSSANPAHTAIEDDWQRVVVMADIERYSEAGAEHHLMSALVRLAEIGDEHWSRVNEAWQQDGKRISGPAAPYADAGRTLLASWHKEGGGLGTDACLPQLPRPLLIKLTRFSLLRSQSPKETDLEAVLALAQALRRQGRLVHGVLGARIFADAMEWAAARGYAADASFRRFRIRDHEVIDMIYREWVCNYRMLQEHLAGEENRDKITQIVMQSESPEKELQLIADIISDELFEFRRQVSAMLLPMRAHSADVRWIAANSNFDGLKKSEGFLVPMLAFDMREHVGFVKSVIDVYKSWIAADSSEFSLSLPPQQ